MKIRPSFVVALTFAAALASPAGAQTECRRPAPRQFTQGQTIVLSETKTFPCKIEFATTSVSLRADASDAISDLGRTVARGPDGSFYTSASRGAEIHVWTATGQFKRAFGVEGRGPGEFGKGPKTFGFSRDGRVFVGDGPPNHRWSVFSPTLVFERTINAAATGTNGEFGFLTDEALYCSTARSTYAGGGGYNIYDFSANADGQPRVVREFAAPILRTPRIVTPSTGLTFWGAPREGPGAAYELELWRADGTLLRTIRRDVPWFPKSLGDGPGTEMEILSDDGTGIVLVGLMIPDAAKFVAAGKESDPVKRRALQNGAIDIYFEAIDGNAGVVLASWGPFPPSVATKTLPTGFIPRSRTAYRYETDADGFGIFRIVDLKLLAR